jgi:hypothetical protein
VELYIRYPPFFFMALYLGKQRDKFTSEWSVSEKAQLIYSHSRPVPLDAADVHHGLLVRGGGCGQGGGMPLLSLSVHASER